VLGLTGSVSLLQQLGQLHLNPVLSMVEAASSRVSSCCGFWYHNSKGAGVDVTPDEEVHCHRVADYLQLFAEMISVPKVHQHLGSSGGSGLLPWGPSLQ
jgi:hypothetical protein